MDPTTDLILSLVTLAICVIFVFIGIRGRFAEKTNIRPYRMPWMIIALIAIALAFMVVVHLVNLMGFDTGR